jgi:hyperosmotically inducible protein
VGTQMSDTGITSKIKAKYVADPDVKALNVSVTTDEGVVYLTGRVETEAQKDKAQRLAEETSGVKKVVNHIQVGQSG